MSCRARNGFAPRRVATNVSSCARGSPSRFTRSLDTQASFDAATLARTRAELNFTEKISDFARGRIRGIGTMNDVFVDAGGKIRTNRSLGGLLRVGGAHDLAILGNGVFTFQHLRDHGAGRHEADQVLEKWPFTMHRVKTLGFNLRQLHHAGCDHFQTRLLKAPIYLADQVAADAVRLDDGKGSLDGHHNLVENGRKSALGSGRQRPRSVLERGRSSNRDVCRSACITWKNQPNQTTIRIQPKADPPFLCSRSEQLSDGGRLDPR